MKYSKIAAEILELPNRQSLTLSQLTLADIYRLNRKSRKTQSEIGRVIKENNENEEQE